MCMRLKQNEGVMELVISQNFIFNIKRKEHVF